MRGACGVAARRQKKLSNQKSNGAKEDLIEKSLS
jgi:hypothetical protein